MINNEDFYKLKQDAIDLLRKRLTEDVRKRLANVDERLLTYLDDCATNVSNVFGDENDRHSMWELLCACKFIRMFNTYHFNVKKVQFYLRLREGVWRRDGKAWRYVEGGLRLPSTSGAKVYRWQPFQVFVLATVFGFYSWINTKVEAGTKDELLDTEREKDGFVWDFRRMVAEFIMYGPRKIDKTGLSSYIQLVFFLFADFNAEIYALAMTENQSKILFDRTKFMLGQVNKSDEGNPLFRMTEKVVDWLKKYRETIRNSKIVPLTGGGKAPDGTNTQLLNWDELGSDPYVNGKSSMQAHINVCQSSMGMRREPLTFGTTTAGTITSGPFIEMLEGRHNLLLMEFKYETGEATPSQTLDSQMCLLLEPDEYEKPNEEYILTSHALRRKINPMLGIIVQYDFYDREMAKARQDGEQKFAECVSKLFNVYRGLRVTKWLTGDQIRPRQVERRITDCKYEDGWNIFVGLDFGGNDDLFAVDYLGVNYRQDMPADQRMFADCEVWIVEKAMLESPNRQLYELWVAQGWLKVCPGEVFNPDYAINDLMSKNQHGLNLFMFGYDPAQSIQPINTIKAWLQSLGIDAATIKRMVVPVPQSFVNMNGLIQKLEWLLLGQEYDIESGGWSYTNDTPFLYLSNSPLWPWCFGNAKVEISSSELRAIRKTQQHTKIDPIHALLDACYVFDLSEGNIQQ
jgi:phage terminase large subunit-like protein